MKVKIEKFNGELPDYLTVGKVYEVIHGAAPIMAFSVVIQSLLSWLFLHHQHC